MKYYNLFDLLCVLEWIILDFLPTTVMVLWGNGNIYKAIAIACAFIALAAHNFFIWKKTETYKKV